MAAMHRRSIQCRFPTASGPVKSIRTRPPVELSVRRLANQDLDARGATFLGISSAVDLGLLDVLAHEHVETQRRQSFALEPLPQCLAGGSGFGRGILETEDFESGALEIVPRLGR